MSPYPLQNTPLATGRERGRVSLGNTEVIKSGLLQTYGKREEYPSFRIPKAQNILQSLFFMGYYILSLIWQLHSESAVPDSEVIDG